MTRHRASRWVFVVLGGFVGLAVPVPAAAGDSPTTPSATRQAPATPEAVILQALLSNPVTAPYRFAVRPAGRQFALSGRVGTKFIHDAAIRTVIALGYPVRDDLTIDTGETYRVAALAAATAPAARFATGSGVGAGAVPYVYPPPLMGRLDDPFFGLEPPLVSYPPWWRAVAAREPIYGNPSDPTQQAPGAAPGPLAQAPGAASDPAPNPGPPPGTIDMTLDQNGVAVLRGQVPTLADRVAVGQEIARMPGVRRVINLLQTGGAAPAASDVPPPPPTPALRPVPGGAEPSSPHPNAQPAPERPAIDVGADPLARRVGDAIARRPVLANLPLKVTGRDGVVTLSGRAPSAYEAMMAFRAAEQTPGVREVIDQMEFAIPDAGAPNPLRDKGRPQDVEPYLTAQLRRQIGDLAHVDQVRLRGDTLEVRGTVARGDDTPRVEAALRSVPLLRGFRVEPHFLPE